MKKPGDYAVAMPEQIVFDVLPEDGGAVRIQVVERESGLLYVDAPATWTGGILNEVLHQSHRSTPGVIMAA